jgi:hypothetical protein
MFEPVTAYSPGDWSELFVAAAGATAALSGLIFVGLSVNIQEVLEIERGEGQNFLTGRAVEALVALLNVLVISLVGLTPGIADGVLAGVILLTAADSAISPVRLAVAVRQSSLDRRTGPRFLMAVLLTASLTGAGVTLAAHAGGGLDWLPVAFVLAIAVAAINAWVLLVEILR